MLEVDLWARHRFDCEKLQWREIKGELRYLWLEIEWRRSPSDWKPWTETTQPSRVFRLSYWAIQVGCRDLGWRHMRSVGSGGGLASSPIPVYRIWPNKFFCSCRCHHVFGSYCFHFISKQVLVSISWLRYCLGTVTIYTLINNKVKSSPSLHLREVTYTRQHFVGGLYSNSINKQLGL